MKKILMILDNAYRPDLRVEKEINTLLKMGCKIDLICWDRGDDLKEFEECGSLRITRIKLFTRAQQGIKQITNLFRFYRICLIRIPKEEYNFVYVHDFLMLPLGVILKRKLNCKLIYDAHEIYHLMDWEKYPSYISNTIFKVEKFFINFVDEFIVVNKTRKEFYHKYIKREVHILGNWYDKYEGESEDLKKVLEINDSELLFGYFGTLNFTVRKVNYLIDSILEIPNAHIVIAGTGCDENEIKELSENNSRIHYLGWVSEIRKYFGSIDYILYFLNSERRYFNYTAPNTLYLALSHSIPIISNVPGETKELIDNCNIGYCVNKNQKISSLFNNKTDLNSHKTLVENINRIKDSYSWADSFKIYKKILEN